MRVPAWADRSRLTAPDEQGIVGPGMVAIERAFEVGDEVALHLPMAPRWTAPDPRIDAVRGTVAAERGPVVVCLESVDLPGHGDIEGIRVNPTIAPTSQGTDVLVDVELAAEDLEGGDWPYQQGARVDQARGKAIKVPMIPYHDWANRGPATIRVWLPIRSEVSQ